MEYRFLTADTSGKLEWLDGQFVADNTTVDEYCQLGGWEIEHAQLEKSFGEQPAQWQFVVARPRRTSTRTPSEPAAFVGVAGGGL